MHLNQDKICNPLCRWFMQGDAVRSPVPTLSVQLTSTPVNNRSDSLIHTQLPTFKTTQPSLSASFCFKTYIHAHHIHVYQCSLKKQNQEAQPSSTIHT